MLRLEEKETKRNSRWTLQGMIRNGSLVIPNPLNSHQERLVPDYLEALRVASSSQVSSPIFSHYIVREAIGPIGKKKYPAGNIEYGHLQALHGEESAIVTLKTHYPLYDGEVILGIIAGEEGNIGAPCGNCRDLMLDTMGGRPEKLHIVSGAQTGGLAIATDLRTYLFEEYEQVDSLTQSIAQEVELIRINAQEKMYDPYSPPDHPYPERIYLAGISDGNGALFTAGHWVDADYHPTYAIENAIVQAGSNIFMDHVVILSHNPNGQPPHVMYRDRQRLFGHNQKQEDILEKQLNPKIILVNESGGELQIWQTTVKEWLPLPFSADSFGPFREDIRRYNILNLR